MLRWRPSFLARLPWGLIGLLAAVWAVEGALTRCDLDFTTPWAMDWRLTGKAAQREAVRAEVLGFGDSLAKFGFLPRVFERRTGLATHNLAVNVGMAPASYFLLRRALEAGGRPKAAVIDFKPHLLAVDQHYMIRQWPELLDPRECLDLARTTGDPGLFAAVLLARLLPSYKERFEIRAGVFAALEGRLAGSRYTVPPFMRNWRQNLGAQVMPGGTAFDDGLLANPALDDPGWRCSPLNATYLDRFLDLAASRAITVFWVVPPPIPEVQGRRDRNGSEAKYFAFARSVQERHANLVIVDSRGASYPRAVHVDPIHLDRKGATSFTADVAEVVTRALAGDRRRWVALPSFAERPDGGVLEDVNQSQLALKAAFGPKR